MEHLLLVVHSDSVDNSLRYVLSFTCHCYSLNLQGANLSVFEETYTDGLLHLPKLTSSMAG